MDLTKLESDPAIAILDIAVHPTDYGNGSILQHSFPTYSGAHPNDFNQNDGVQASIT